ncbi:MAG: hypothetical protein DWQ05_12070 [Calditrichaeota bacterium]|nr:MAG: hypothetical protein DWQ05_12070 [Calditrichota bacterium]
MKPTNKTKITNENLHIQDGFVSNKIEKTARSIDDVLPDNELSDEIPAEIRILIKNEVAQISKKLKIRSKIICAVDCCLRRNAKNSYLF